MAYETLKLDISDDGIATLTINRPDKLNALNETVIAELAQAAEELGDEDTLRAVVITGAGRAFVAGADIAAMADFSDEQAMEFAEDGHATMDALNDLPVPVIAAVNGFALGGGLELAVACDLIYASEKALFGLPEVSLGIIPGFGGTQRLARFVGWHKAREMVFTGDKIQADEAKQVGLALDVFSADGFLDSVYDVARTIASRGPVAVTTAKAVMRDGLDLPLDEGLAAERESFSGLFDTEDRAEGMKAFLEKREPEFKGQ